MCSHKMAASLYSRLQRECEAHIKAEGEKLQGQSGEAEVYLNIVNHCWQEHCRHTLMIRNIFLYLDRTYVISTSSSSPAAAVKNIWEMCIALFRTHVISHADIQRKTVASLLYLIEQER
jgi:cullin-4